MKHRLLLLYDADLRQLYIQNNNEYNGNCLGQAESLTDEAIKT